jgi:plasmid stabilization system protein ParE
MAPGALKDIDESYEWYNVQKAELGNRFINCLDERITELSITPNSGSIRYDNIRCALVKVFPYLIHYSVDETSEVIIVYRILHISKKPQWKK